MKSDEIIRIIEYSIALYSFARPFGFFLVKWFFEMCEDMSDMISNFLIKVYKSKKNKKNNDKN